MAPVDTIKNDYKVLSYAQFPDPDAEGNFSSVICTVTYKDTKQKFSEVEDVSIGNYYGTESFKKDDSNTSKLSTFTPMYNGSGPWVLPGDGTSKDIEWR